MVPSTTTVNVPVGTVAIELDCGDTVMVITSFAPADGELLAGESEVVVAASEAAAPEGQAVSKL